MTTATTLGCGPLGAASSTEPRDPAVQAAVRSADLANQAAYDTAADERLAELEAGAQKALSLVLGVEAEAPGSPPPSSALLRALKEARVGLHLEPAKDANGNALGEELLELRAEPQGGSSLLPKVAALRAQVTAVSTQARLSNDYVQTATLTTLSRVVELVRLRETNGLAFDSADYLAVTRALERQKRAEAIAGTNMAVLAAYQAIINGNRDPQALDVIAGAVRKALPVKVQLTEADARAYVGRLDENAKRVRSGYEVAMRKAHGDARYERTFKPSADMLFSGIENARGSLSSSKARAGDSAGLPPTAKALRDAVPAAAQPGLASFDALSADGPVGASLRGIAALRRGDPREALTAAAALVPAPIPGLKQAVGLASKLLFD